MRNIEKVYQQYFQIVFKYIFCLTHDMDLTEEITQEVFYRALKSLNDFRGDCKMSVWLCQIGKYIWINEYKRRDRYEFRSIDEFSDHLLSTENVESIVIERENKTALYQAIDLLDETIREVMYLRINGELSFREIGDILEKNETWARVTFYRGKQKIIKEGLN